MIGNFGKNYLHISLTQKCNLGCVYCKSENMYYDNTYDKLTVDDYKFLIKSMSEIGISKVRFSGGEPLLYPRLIELIRFAKEECNIEDIGIITNGILLYELAYQLRDAGVSSVNISLDSLKEYKYKSITNGGTLKNVLKSIELCTKLGFDIKINCVVIDGFNDDELYDFMIMTHYYPIDVRFREIIPVKEAIKVYKQGYFNVGNFINKIEELKLVESNERVGTKYYKYNGAKGRIGVISSVCSSEFVKNNKIIVDSNGFMKVGANLDTQIDIKEYLQKPMMFKETIKEIIYK